MNDYMKLIAHAAAKFSGRPAVLSPLLDSYCGWENKKNRFSSEPIEGDLRIILSAGGLLFEELGIHVELVEKKDENVELVEKEDENAELVPNGDQDIETPSIEKYSEYEGLLRICMKHDSKNLGENNFNWSRDCTYEYEIITSLAHQLAVYWTDDDFLVTQARSVENPLFEEYKVEDIKETVMTFKLIPTEVIDVLEPALNVPFLKQILKAIKKKSGDVCSYVDAATDVPEANDVLSLLTCIPITEVNEEADL